jgi:hypothetical protein
MVTPKSSTNHKYLQKKSKSRSMLPFRERCHFGCVPRVTLAKPRSTLGYDVPRLRRFREHRCVPRIKSDSDGSQVTSDGSQVTSDGSQVTSDTERQRTTNDEPRTTNHEPRSPSPPTPQNPIFSWNQPPIGTEHKLETLGPGVQQRC